MANCIVPVDRFLKQAFPKRGIVFVALVLLTKFAMLDWNRGVSITKPASCSIVLLIEVTRHAQLVKLPSLNPGPHSTWIPLS